MLAMPGSRAPNRKSQGIGDSRHPSLALVDSGGTRGSMFEYKVPSLVPLWQIEDD